MASEGYELILKQRCSFKQDLDNCYLCGTMEALNVPLAGTPVVTFWEGELIDAKNYTFYIGELLPFWEGELIDAKK